MQLDLFSNMYIDSIKFENTKLEYKREANTVIVRFPGGLKAWKTGYLLVGFSGRPQVARNAPWDGGFIWSQDKNQKPWIGVACEGLGASCWWPMKDHLSDEPDSLRLTITAPENLMAVGNGQLRNTSTPKPGWKTWQWAVTYPINSYNVTVNIADYVQIHDTFVNSSGVHDLDYYVLSYNREKAIRQFAQVKPMMRIYEKYFGEYPFWQDGYALVETPYLGITKKDMQDMIPFSWDSTTL
jgi:aminopeptidase N